MSPIFAGNILRAIRALTSLNSCSLGIPSPPPEPKIQFPSARENAAFRDLCTLKTWVLLTRLMTKKVLPAGLVGWLVGWLVNRSSYVVRSTPLARSGPFP